MTKSDKILAAIEQMPGCTPADIVSLTGMDAKKVHEILQNARRRGAITIKRPKGSLYRRYWITVGYEDGRINPDLILQVMAAHDGEIPTKAIAQALGTTRGKIRHRMGELARAGIISKRSDHHGAVFWRIVGPHEVPQYNDRPPVSGPKAQDFLRSVRWKPHRDMDKFLQSMCGVHARGKFGFDFEERPE